MTSPALTITGLTKRFGASTLLSDIDLTVPGGSLLTLVGESGSGKSTLLRIIAGLETPDAGSVSYEGRPVGVVKRPAARWAPPRGRQDAVPVGFVFQQPVLYPHLTLEENILFAQRLHTHQQLDRDHYLSLVDTLGLGEHLGKKPAHLSGGQAQRAGIARALVRKPALALFDEPLSSVDEHLSEAIRADLLTLHSQLGFTGIYVTHTPDEALTMGQQLAVLEGGRLAQVAAPGQVLAAPASAQVARLLHPLYNELSLDSAGQAVLAGISAHGFERADANSPGALPVRVLGVLAHTAGTRYSLETTQATHLPHSCGNLLVPAGTRLTAVLPETPVGTGQGLHLQVRPGALHLFK
ncbi:ABC transporter ATP-binding protein [Rothia nasimurium]|uniref:ABC transporter ATP-binding protein n=1 Tax=Rothia nasimurium TaxID=85336 RepID=UPI001F1FD8B5|nr:ABC transporter ATP-binding protein [Rothia nasimurium]